MTKPKPKDAPETAPEPETPTDTAPEAEGAPDLTEGLPVNAEGLTPDAIDGLSPEEAAAILSQMSIEDDDGEIEGDPIPVSLEDATITHLRWKTEMGVSRPDFQMRDFDRYEIRDMKRDEVLRMAQSPFYEVTIAPEEG